MPKMRIGKDKEIWKEKRRAAVSLPFLYGTIPIVKTKEKETKPAMERLRLGKTEFNRFVRADRALAYLGQETIGCDRNPSARCHTA